MATTADVWADSEHAIFNKIFNKVIDQWRKRLRAFMKAKGEHFERLL